MQLDSRGYTEYHVPPKCSLGKDMVPFAFCWGCSMGQCTLTSKCPDACVPSPSILAALKFKPFAQQLPKVSSIWALQSQAWLEYNYHWSWSGSVVLFWAEPRQQNKPGKRHDVLAHGLAGTQNHVSYMAFHHRECLVLDGFSCLNGDSLEVICN